MSRWLNFHFWVNLLNWYNKASAVPNFIISTTVNETAKVSHRDIICPLPSGLAYTANPSFSHHPQEVTLPERSEMEALAVGEHSFDLISLGRNTQTALLQACFWCHHQRAHREICNLWVVIVSHSPGRNTLWNKAIGLWWQAASQQLSRLLRPNLQKVCMYKIMCKLDSKLTNFK